MDVWVFLVFGYHEKDMNTLVQGFLWTYIFISLGQKPKSEISDPTVRFPEWLLALSSQEFLCASEVTGQTHILKSNTPYFWAPPNPGAND